MTAALRYLLVRSFINGVATRVKRLRQPKYIAGALIGGAYFYFYIYKFLFHGISNGAAPTLSLEVRAGIGAAVLLVATVLLSWVRPSSRAAIHFTEAEIAFLFPAPISRRRLIVHKLLKSQFALLLLSVFMTLLTGRFKLGVAAWFAMAGWWIILNTLNMHRIAASFALHRLGDRGAGGWARRVLLLLAILGAAVVGWAVWRALPPLPAPTKGNAGFFGLTPEYIGAVLNSGPLPLVLAPFKLVIAPFLATALPAFLAALPAALGIMAAHFLWIIAADVAFEESAIAASARRAKVIAAFHEGRLRPSAKSGKARTPVWRLRMRGFAPNAFVWKSLIRFGGRRAMLLWLLLFAALAALANFLRTHIGPNPSSGMIALIIVTGAACYITVLISLVMVGQSASAQLRKGMASMDLLKTFPLPGWKLALGELAGPVLLGSALQWAAIGIGTLLVSGFAASSIAGTKVLALSASALLVLLPMFNLSMSILPSAATLLFPGWFKPQDVTSSGVENTGLRLMVGVLQLLAMAGAMLPVVLFGGLAWILSGIHDLDLAWRVVCAAGTGAFVFAMEAALGIAWLGGLYDRYDGSSE
jgi:ABC-2 type transport system permease protein